MAHDTGILMTHDNVRLLHELYLSLDEYVTIDGWGDNTERFLRHYGKVLGDLVCQFTPYILRRCKIVDDLNYDNIVRPFCLLVDIDSSAYVSHAALLGNFRTSLSRWIVDAETRHHTPRTSYRVARKCRVVP